MTPAPDVERELARSLAAFDETAHEALVADQREAAAQTVAQALVYAAEDADRALVRDILAALHAADLHGVYGVFACHDGMASLWMTGPAKTRSTALRDEGIAALREAGFEVVLRGSWDITVRRI